MLSWVTGLVFQFYLVHLDVVKSCLFKLRFHLLSGIIIGQTKLMACNVQGFRHHWARYVFYVIIY